MERHTPPAWFLGDLADPWVAALAGVLPREVPRLACPAGLPDSWPSGLVSARLLILHRAVLTSADADRLRDLRGRGTPPPRIILCTGPHARYHQWARWSALVDLVLPEATAVETLARHLPGFEAPPRVFGPRPPVAIVSTHHELRQTLADSCAWAGYPAEPARDWSEVPPGGLALWDVPVLEEDWPDRLTRWTRGRSVVAFLGFADRAVVSLARSRGAAACLDLPWDLADLAFVLDRLTARRPRSEPAHTLPPPPAALRLVPGRNGVQTSAAVVESRKGA